MTDRELQQHVQNALDWEPSVDATEIGVTVDNGVVTLRGDVPSFAAKETAERVALRVYGVKAVANDINVRLVSGYERTDSEIAQAAAHALRWHSLVPEDKVKVEVEDGWIRLSGETDWAYQRASAEQSVRPLVGVRGVTNDISIKARANASEISRDISSALERHARREAQRIAVDVEGGVVTLRGTVESLADRQAVVGTAYAARGVSRVVDLKTPGSKEMARNRLENIPLLTARDQVKFVLCGRGDYEWAREMVAEHRLAERCDVLFSPSKSELDPRDLADWIVADRLPVRFQMQLHKLLWNDEPGR